MSRTTVQTFALEMHALEIGETRKKILASLAELEAAGLPPAAIVTDTKKIAGDLAAVEQAVWTALGVTPP